jgi:VWFA-related protein
VFLRYIALFALLCAFAFAQQPVSIPGEQVPTFQSKVNLVLVPVVVRDSQGRPIANLTKEDFQLFDKGKRQAILSFSAIDRNTKRTGRLLPVVRAQATTDLEHGTKPAPGSVGIDAAKSVDQRQSPNRNLIYVFDDVNIRFASTADIREAAIHYFQNNLAPGDRAGIYTVSGNPTLEFTNNREKLDQTVSKLRWRPRPAPERSVPMSVITSRT